jgi:uncharacterized protein (DUF3820 family)
MLVTFGKHKGTELSEVPADYLQWCLQNFGGGPAREMFAAELSRRQLDVPKQVTKVDRLKQKRYLDTETHTSWTDRTGRVHRVPNDVSMSGRDDEPCPFDATPECEFEPLTDLDREFRAIVA